MVMRFLVGIALVTVTGCSSQLPNGYRVSHGDRGKAWLQNPDGTLAHGGLIKELYRDDRRILLIAYPEQLDGEPGRTPIDRTCYVALLIDSPGRQVRQITTGDAAQMATKMSVVEAYDRPCLKGMPNTPD